MTSYGLYIIMGILIKDFAFCFLIIALKLILIVAFSKMLKFITFDESRQQNIVHFIIISIYIDVLILIYNFFIH